MPGDSTAAAVPSAVFTLFLIAWMSGPLGRGGWERKTEVLRFQPQSLTSESKEELEGAFAPDEMRALNDAANEARELLAKFGLTSVVQFIHARAVERLKSGRDPSGRCCTIERLIDGSPRPVRSSLRVHILPLY